MPAGLDDDRALRILYLLKLARHVDERLASIHRQGRLPGPVPSTRGLEGTLVGAASALRAEDSLFVSHRGLAAQLAKGIDLERTMATLWGRMDGFSRGRDGIDFLGDWAGVRSFGLRSHLAGPCPPAAGAALAYRLRGEERVAMAICEDGAIRDGRWHGSLAASAAGQLPVVWVLAATNGNVPPEGAAGPAMSRRRVDGADVLEVHRAAAEAVERARAGDGPTLLEAVRPNADGDAAERFADLLLAEGVVDEEGVREMDSRVERAFSAAHAFAQRSTLPDSVVDRAGT